MQLCAPPASLAHWATALLVGACVLGLTALTLAPLRPSRWRSRRLGALTLCGALLAVGMAVWSLILRTRAQATYDLLATRSEQNPYYCVIGGGHAGPGYYAGWLRQTAALIGSLQRAALITVIAYGAFVLLGSVVAFALWRRGNRKARTLPQARLGNASDASDDTDDVQVSALHPQTLRAPRSWMGYRRVLAVCVALAVIIAGAGAFAAAHARQPTAQTPACSAAQTASILRQLQRDSIILSPTNDAVPVDAQMALAISTPNVDPGAIAAASCQAMQLTRVQAIKSSVLSLGEDIWAIAYHLPAGVSYPQGITITYPEDIWSFVDARTAVWSPGPDMVETPERAEI